MPEVVVKFNKKTVKNYRRRVKKLKPLQPSEILSLITPVSSVQSVIQVFHNRKRNSYVQIIKLRNNQKIVQVSWRDEPIRSYLL